MSTAFRRFGEEIVTMIGKTVRVETSDGRSYQGELLGIDDKLNLVLDKVMGVGNNVFRIVLSGGFVKEIRLVEKPFNLKALSDRLGRVFPGMVKLREDIGAIIVMDKIKVTESGVAEGTGLAADRVRAVYEEFIKELGKES